MLVPNVVLLIATIKCIVLSVIIPNVVMLNVMEPNYDDYILLFDTFLSLDRVDHSSHLGSI
jgi:hypothetical protein